MSEKECKHMTSNGERHNSNPGNADKRSDDVPRRDGSADLALASTGRYACDPLWTPEQVAERLNVSPDWVRDHSSRKEPRLPVIRLGGGPGRAGLLRYRASEIEKFIEEMERLSGRTTRRGI